MADTCATCIHFIDQARPVCEHPGGLTAPAAWLSCRLYVEDKKKTDTTRAPAPVIKTSLIGCRRCGGVMTIITGRLMCHRCGATDGPIP